jgi:hypothetical protein
MSTELGKQIVEAVKRYVATHVERVLSRVEQVASSLEQLQTFVRSLPEPQKGDKGEPGADGRSPTSDELRALIAPLIPEVTPGPPGERGAPGEKGDSPSNEQLLAIIRPLVPAAIPGERGPPGEKGERGADGRTPAADELRAIIEPLIPEAIPGPSGERGPPGEKGERGADGRTPAADELRAIIEPLIPAPLPGERGIDGINGKDGRDGVDGRDALHLEILPAIDEARSYPRGTYARHAGGLWRSFEATAGMRGWECIVEGVAEESESLLEDGRTLVRRTVYSSGRTLERSVSMAVILDKGVYRADTQYSAGDTVTWAGSMWIAQRRDASLPYGKPSTPGSGWRLAVKAGRDART